MSEELLEEFDGLPDRPCRVCAAGGNFDMVEIFGQEGCQRGLADLIHRYLPIQVDCCDELPLQVCVSCVLRLEGSHELSRVCAAADVTLRTLYLKQEQREEALHSPMACVEDSFADVEYFGDPDTFPDTLCEPDIEPFTWSRPASVLSEDATSVHRRPGRPVRRKKENSRWVDFELEEVPVVKRRVGRPTVLAPQGKKPTVLAPQVKKTTVLAPQVKKPTVSARKLTTKKEQNFQCVLCPRKFKSAKALNRHSLRKNCGVHITIQQSETKSNVTHEVEVCCDFCQRTFNTKIGLRRHMYQHVRGDRKSQKSLKERARKFVCHLCEKSYVNYNDLYQHLRNHKPGRWDFKCGICGGVFKSENFVLAHIKTHSQAEMSSKKCADLFSKVSDFQCGICDKFCYSRHYLNLHMRSHREGIVDLNVIDPVKKRRVMKCGTCHKIFYKLDAMKNHMATHLTVKPFNCNVCGKGFSIERSLIVHMRRHTGERPFLCDVCGRGFTSQITVQSHRRTVHEKIKNFFCSICNRGFFKKGAAKIHEETHTYGKQCPCDTCGNFYKTKTSMKIHKMRAHSEFHEMFPCEICLREFDCKAARKTHMNLVHAGRGFECGKCDKKFKTLKHLRAHMEIHSERTLVTCELCEKSFKTKSHLKIHLEIHAGAEKKYECIVCHKKFRGSNHLKVHDRIHSGLKPFVCGLCTKAFRHKNALQAHLKAHSRTEDGVVKTGKKKKAKLPGERKIRKAPSKPAGEGKRRGRKPGKKQAAMLPDFCNQAAMLPDLCHFEELPENMQCVENIEIEYVVTASEVLPE